MTAEGVWIIRAIMVMTLCMTLILAIQAWQEGQCRQLAVTAAVQAMDVDAVCAP
jgi:hypothetical protein